MAGFEDKIGSVNINEKMKAFGMANKTMSGGVAALSNAGRLNEKMKIFGLVNSVNTQKGVGNIIGSNLNEKMKVFGLIRSTNNKAKGAKNNIDSVRNKAAYLFGNVQQNNRLGNSKIGGYIQNKDDYNLMRNIQLFAHKPNFGPQKVSMYFSPHKVRRDLYSRNAESANTSFSSSSVIDTGSIDAIPQFTSNVPQAEVTPEFPAGNVIQQDLEKVAGMDVALGQSMTERDAQRAGNVINKGLQATKEFFSKTPGARQALTGKKEETKTDDSHEKRIEKLKELELKTRIQKMKGIGGKTGRFDNTEDRYNKLAAATAAATSNIQYGTGVAVPGGFEASYRKFQMLGNVGTGEGGTAAAYSVNRLPMPYKIDTIVGQIKSQRGIPFGAGMETMGMPIAGRFGPDIMSKVQMYMQRPSQQSNPYSVPEPIPAKPVARTSVSSYNPATTTLQEGTSDSGLTWSDDSGRFVAYRRKKYKKDNNNAEQTQQ
jgi:hypothetical protein